MDPVSGRVREVIHLPGNSWWPLVAGGLLAARLGATETDSIQATFEIPAAAITIPNAPFFEKAWAVSGGVEAGASLGIIDIGSGAVRQVPLGEKSSPHGVVLGPDGMAWITDSGQNAIVRYDLENDRPVRGSNGFLQKADKGEAPAV